MSTTFLQTEDGLYACGYNPFGQLGLDSSLLGHLGFDYGDCVPVLTKVGEDIASFITNGDSTFFIKYDGSVWCCGNNEYNQLGLPIRPVIRTQTELNFGHKVSSISCSKTHTFFTTTEGLLFCCGANDGQLGQSFRKFVTSPTEFKSDLKINSVVCGSFCTFFMTDEGVYCLGSNLSGQLGMGDAKRVKTPTKLDLGCKIITAVSNQYSTFFITEDGVFACGKNEDGQIESSKKPIRTPIKLDFGGEKIVSAYPGRYHSFFTAENGDIYCCGENRLCQLGGNIGRGAYFDKPIKLELPFESCSLICGSHHTFFVTENALYGAGSNMLGELGLGDFGDSEQMTKIDFDQKIILPNNKRFKMTKSARN